MEINLGEIKYTSPAWRVTVDLPTSVTDPLFLDRVWFYISFDSGSLYRHLSSADAISIGTALIELGKQAEARVRAANK